MFVIRKETMQAFQPSAEAGFEQRVMDYLRDNHGDKPVRLPHGALQIAELPEDALREMVRGGIKRGGDYGMSWKSTLLSFVVLLFLTAPNFDRHPKAESLFRREETIDDQDLESLMEEMTDEDWELVEARYDAQAWSLPLD
jgi:hypothetical protein